MNYMLENKKGQVGMVIGIVAIIVFITIILGLFVFSEKYKWLIIGIGVLVGFFYVLGKGMSSEGGFTKGKTTVLILLLAIGLVFIFGSSVLQTAYGEGLTIFSMSPTSVISESTDLRGVWWLVNAKTNGGQSLSGTLSPSQAKVLDGGYLTKNPLSITVSAIDEKINYNIINTGNSIYKYEMYITKSPRDCLNINPFGSSNAPACNAGDYGVDVQTSQHWYTGVNYICQRNCVKKTLVGVVGNIEPVNVAHKADVTVSNGIETIKQTISSDQKSAMFGNIAQVEFTNALWTGNYPPSATSFKGFYNIYKTGQWTLTSDTKINNYFTEQRILDSYLANQQSIIEQLNYPAGANAAESLAFLNNYVASKLTNTNTIEAQIEADQLSISSSQGWLNRGDKNTGKLTIDIDQQIASMNLLFRIRADWLGIVINPGKPDILSSSTCLFKSGDTEEITLSVKNVGSSSGSFNAFIACPNIRQTFISTASTFAKGETKDMKFVLDANNKGALTESCEATVYDVAIPTNKDTYSFSCKVEEPAQCRVGDFSVVGSCLKSCDSITGTVIQKFCCNSDQILLRDLSNISNENGGYYCKQKNGTEPLTCQWFEEQKTQNDVRKSWYNYLGIGQPTIIQTQECVTAGWIYGLILGGVVLILGVALIVVWKPARPQVKSNKKKL